MAIYHCSVKNIGRSGGKSAVASSAYRSGEKLDDLETGLSHDYTKKSGIEYTEIILCENAPKEYQDRATLWNEVQKVEKASDARLAREWELAIPKELSLEQGQKLVHDFGQSLADEGMCVDIAIHDKGDGNRHAHIMGTTRPIKENGEWGSKEKKVYANDYDQNQNPIYNPNKPDDMEHRLPIIDEASGEQKTDSRNRKQWKRATVESTGWNKSEKVEEWRERWANECNKYLSQERKIDHRSYERQGKEQIPTIHEGYEARQIEKNGGISELCEKNRQIKTLNEKIRELVNQLKETIHERFDRFNIGRLERASDNGRATTERNRVAEIRTSGRCQIDREADGKNQRPAEREPKITTIGNEVEQRERETALRNQGYERRKRKTDENERNVGLRESKLAELKREVEQKARDISDKLAKYRGTLGTSGTTRPENSRTTERSAEERLASLRSSRASGELQQGTPKNTVGELLASARAGINGATAKEQDSGASRADREAEQLRLNLERERKAREAEQRARAERAERKARSHSHGIRR